MVNQFHIENTVESSAQSASDAHVTKLTLESAQIAYSARHENGESVEGPDAQTPAYKTSHRHHPLVLWARQSLANFTLVVQFGLAYAKEYSFRFQRRHACQQHLMWLLINPPRNFQPQLLASKQTDKPLAKHPCHNEITPLPLCMPPNCLVSTEEHHQLSLVQSHRCYYLKEKLLHARWTRRPPPSWISNSFPLTMQQSKTKSDVPVYSFDTEQLLQLWDALAPERKLVLKPPPSLKRLWSTTNKVPPPTVSRKKPRVLLSTSSS